MRLQFPAAEILALAQALGSTRDALSVVALRLAEPAGWLAPGECARLSRLSWRELMGEVAGLFARAPLAPWPLRADRPAAGQRAAAAFLAGEGADPLALSGAAEVLMASELAPPRRKQLGAFYTPPEIAALVVELALQNGSIASKVLPSVVDPCVGAGAFVAAAARALAPRSTRRAAALACSGADLSAGALAAARSALSLEAGPEATRDELRGLGLALRDALLDEPVRPVLTERKGPTGAPLPVADLLVSNPPYGKVEDAAERARIAERFAALRGGEIDRYAAFLLRALELVRPGGTAALLVPDTWMTNSRGGGIRAAVLERAELAAVADLGKPFAAAKDTRVQAVVLVRRAADRAKPRPARVARISPNGEASLAALEELAPLDEAALAAQARAGWQPYRSAGERRFCEELEAASAPFESALSVGYGLRTGDNTRHVKRRWPEPGEVALIGGEDIVPFALRWKPKALPLASLDELGELARRQLGRPRVAIQRIRTNSARPHARWLEAALCPADKVCLDSLSTLACESDELLWAALGLVCSTALNRYHRLRTTDVNVKPALLASLPLPLSLLAQGGARPLAELSRARAQEVGAELDGAAESSAPALERRIDAEVYRLFALSDASIEVCERAHWGARFDAERPRLPLSAALPA